MTGVKTEPRQQLPKISVEDKAKILGREAGAPKKWTKAGISGVPFFWGESKSKVFWIGFLKDNKVKVVIDVTPGTDGFRGSLCRDSLFFGLTRNAIRALV